MTASQPRDVSAETTARVDAAVEALRKQAAAEGYVLMRAASRARLLERVRVAEALRAAADEQREQHFAWMQESVFPEERRIRERLTFVYGVARAHGATVDELRGPYREDQS